MIVFSEFVTEIGCLHHAVLKVQLLFAQYSLTWSIHAMLINRQHVLTNTVQNLLSLQNLNVQISKNYQKIKFTNFPSMHYSLPFASLVPEVVLIPLKIATELSMTISESIWEN